MGSYGAVYVGSVQVVSIKNRVWPELLAVFTDSMYHSRLAEAAEFYVDTEPGATVTAHEFTARGQIIAGRLDVLGFTPDRVYYALDHRLDQARRLCDFPLWKSTDPEWTARNEAERAFLESYSAHDWIADLRSVAPSRAEDSMTPGTLKWLMSHVEDEEDERLVLRAFLLARPDDEVRLDVTDLVADGWLDDCPAGICASGLSAMRGVAATHAPIVVLTEGKSDIAVLEPAFRLLNPHLSDLVRFMDYGERPTGGAGPLVNTVRSFAAAGIANRVVALFDNDTAATDALRSLDRARLPENIRVCQYPPLDLARHYPTLGPPPADSGVAYADVNGLAGSIEMYLGRDILTLQDGTLRPVQWHTYIAGARQYQGEITGKQVLHEAYRAKLRAAEIDPSNIAKQDWAGIHSIFDVVLLAFRSDEVSDQQP
jgi:hypothetical protein